VTFNGRIQAARLEGTMDFVISSMMGTENEQYRFTATRGDSETAPASQDGRARASAAEGSSGRPGRKRKVHELPFGRSSHRLTIGEDRVVFSGFPLKPGKRGRFTKKRLTLRFLYKDGLVCRVESGDHLWLNEHHIRSMSRPNRRNRMSSGPEFDPLHAEVCADIERAQQAWRAAQQRKPTPTRPSTPITPESPPQPVTLPPDEARISIYRQAGNARRRWMLRVGPVGGKNAGFLRDAATGSMEFFRFDRVNDCTVEMKPDGGATEGALVLRFGKTRGAVPAEHRLEFALANQPGEPETFVANLRHACGIIKRSSR